MIYILVFQKSVTPEMDGMGSGQIPKYNISILEI